MKKEITDERLGTQEGVEDIKQELLRLMLLGEGLVSASTLKQELSAFKQDIQGAYRQLTSDKTEDPTSRGSASFSGGSLALHSHSHGQHPSAPSGGVQPGPLDGLLAELSVFNFDGTDSVLGTSSHLDFQHGDAEGEDADREEEATSAPHQDHQQQQAESPIAVISGFEVDPGSTPMTDNPLFGLGDGSTPGTPDPNFSFGRVSKLSTGLRLPLGGQRTPPDISSWLEASSAQAPLPEATSRANLSDDATPPGSPGSLPTPSSHADSQVIRPANLFAALFRSPPGSPSPPSSPPPNPAASLPPSPSPGPSQPILEDITPFGVIRCPEPTTPPTAPILPSPLDLSNHPSSMPSDGAEAPQGSWGMGQEAGWEEQTPGPWERTPSRDLRGSQSECARLDQGGSARRSPLGGLDDRRVFSEIGQRRGVRGTRASRRQPGDGAVPFLDDLQSLKLAQELANELEDQNSIMHSQMLSAEKQLQETLERLVSGSVSSKQATTPMPGTPVVDGLGGLSEAASSPALTVVLQQTAAPEITGGTLLRLDETDSDAATAIAELQRQLATAEAGLAEAHAAAAARRSDEFVGDARAEAAARRLADGIAAELRRRLAAAEAELVEVRTAAAEAGAAMLARGAQLDTASRRISEESRRADGLAAALAAAELRARGLAEEGAGWRTEVETLRARLVEVEAENVLLRKQQLPPVVPVTPSTRSPRLPRNPFGEIYPSNLGAASRTAPSPLLCTPKPAVAIEDAPGGADRFSEGALDAIRQDRVDLEAQLTASEMRAAGICRRLATTREAFAAKAARQKSLGLPAAGSVDTLVAAALANSSSAGSHRSLDSRFGGAMQRLSGPSSATPEYKAGGRHSFAAPRAIGSGFSGPSPSLGATPPSPLAQAIAGIRAREQGIQMNFAANTPPSSYRSPASPDKRNMRWSSGASLPALSIERSSPRRVFAELLNTADAGSARDLKELKP